MRVAIQIASKDPNEALAVARDSLKNSLDYSALESSLQPAFSAEGHR